MRTSINKKLYLFISIVLIIGIIVGIVFVTLLDESTKEILFLNINEFLQNMDKSNIDFFITHLIILSTLLVTSTLLIGGPLIIFFLIYNGFAIGFIISSITCIFGIKGLLFGIIYVIISKLIFLVLLIIISVNLFKIVKCIIDCIVYKKNNKEVFITYIKRTIIFISIIILNDIILYFWGLKLVNIFNFLIK